ncbi:hypothetical protein K6W39_06710 [Burkholderia ambifaria]|nr:hypothetical protein [Burkholderia ambifaria]
MRELEVVVEPFASEHDTGEAVVIGEAREYRQFEPVAVHALGSGEIGDGAGDAPVGETVRR